MLHTEIIENRTSIHHMPEHFRYSTFLYKEMSLSADEFFTALKDAVKGSIKPDPIMPGYIQVKSNDYIAIIELIELSDRVVGLLRIPTLGVSIEYRGKYENGYKTFINTFNRRFLRMGG